MDDKDIVDTIISLDGSDSDLITINLDETMGATTAYPYSGVDTLTITGDSDYSFDFSDIDLGPLTFERTVWQDSLPEMSDVETMCEHYPGFKKAFENFKTAYKLVEQDYKGKLESGEIKKDDGIPF